IENKLTFDPEGHKYSLNGKPVPSVTQILHGAGLMDFSNIHPERLERSRKFGEAVHRACELYDLNNLNVNTLSLPLIPYLETWKKFREDYGMDGIGTIEEKICSERWQYAGTLDRIYPVHCKLTLIDIKSTTTLDPTVALQTAGYKIAWEEMT